MKEAFLVLGPENCGTRMLAQALVGAGCFGEYGTAQQMDNGCFHGLPDLIMYRVPLPAWHNWPDLERIAGKLEAAGYRVKPLIILRDWNVMADSQVKNHLVKDRGEAFRNARRAIVYGFLSMKDREPVAVSYEALIHSAGYRKWLFEDECGLAMPEMGFRDENAKHYA